jgi:hypothetical protein
MTINTKTSIREGGKITNSQQQAVTKMAPHRRISLAAGIFYLLTFVSIPSLVVFYPQVKSANYILGVGPDTYAIIGGILEIIVALSGIATAVILFPILKKQSEILSLGLVASRVVEASSIFLGVAFILSVVTLRQTGAGVDALASSNILVILYERTFLLSQSFMPAINDLLLGFLLYKSRLVPRALSLIGIVGGPVLIAGYLAVLFGLVGQQEPLAGLSALLVALFELLLGIWLTFKGFNASATNELMNKA